MKQLNLFDIDLAMNDVPNNKVTTLPEPTFHKNRTWPISTKRRWEYLIANGRKADAESIGLEFCVHE